MHELSVAESALKIARRVSAAHGNVKVTGIRLSVGSFDHLDDEALCFAFEMLADETVCRGAAIAIERHPFKATCGACGEKSESEGIAEVCPACGSAELKWEGEEATRVVSVDLDLPDVNEGV